MKKYIIKDFSGSIALVGIDSIEEVKELKLFSSISSEKPSMNYYKAYRINYRNFAVQLSPETRRNMKKTKVFSKKNAEGIFIKIPYEKETTNQKSEIIFGSLSDAYFMEFPDDAAAELWCELNKGEFNEEK